MPESNACNPRIERPSQIDHQRSRASAWAQRPALSPVADYKKQAAREIWPWPIAQVWYRQPRSASCRTSMVPHQRASGNLRDQTIHHRVASLDKRHPHQPAWLQTFEQPSLQCCPHRPQYQSPAARRPVAAVGRRFHARCPCARSTRPTHRVLFFRSKDPNC